MCPFEQAAHLLSDMKKKTLTDITADGKCLQERAALLRTKRPGSARREKHLRPRDLGSMRTRSEPGVDAYLLQAAARCQKQAAPPADKAGQVEGDARAPQVKSAWEEHKDMEDCNVEALPEMPADRKCLSERVLYLPVLFAAQPEKDHRPKRCAASDLYLAQGDAKHHHQTPPSAGKTGPESPPSQLRHAKTAGWEESSEDEAEDEKDSCTESLRVGRWVFRGGMTPLASSGASAALANSSVRVGPATHRRRASAPELVALKSVKIHGGDAESLAMLKRECAILRELGDSHPHILPMLHSGELPSTNELVLLTRFAPQGDLSGLTPAGTCVEELQVRRLTSQVMSALAFLHERSIVHGDIKPQNVFLTLAKGALLAQVADFGLATKLPDGQTSVVAKRIQGSHGYIPAEVIDHQEISCAVDLFAWGVVVFRLLGSYSPFYPASAVKSPLEFDKACWDPVSQEARIFVQRLLSREPHLRGKSEEHLEEPGGWLSKEETELTGACARGQFAPKRASGISFHDLEASRVIWQDLATAR